MLAILSLAVLLFGWIADLLLGSAAFGTLMNSMIVLVGAFAGAWLWQRYGVPTRFPAEVVRTVIATGSGLLLLIGMAVIRP
ncbi:hypothetical protein [Bosea sp. (in: a-proteobacteria)]|nr:hypothetical protein [Bosea sp. (in: a-proteobacteria)]TAJ30095.1 MAG: hypothetical protein EPO59_12525 [Bosea sp. (in: a-proteobacteria)]